MAPSIEAFAPVQNNDYQYLLSLWAWVAGSK